MLHTVLLFPILLVIVHVSQCTAESDFYYPHNISRSTLSGVAEYRSALTLDWLAAEDSRQRELALAFETEAAIPAQILASDCISYGKPASGKVARLMLELLKNLEGDEGYLVPELIQALIRTKLLVETSMLEAEPDLESLVKTPAVMMGEPHATFPRILAMIWMAATDPTTVKKSGWCPISRVAKYLVMTRPVLIAKHMRNLDPVIARVRYIMEDFIQHVTPNIYDKKHLEMGKTKSMYDKRVSNRPMYNFHMKMSPKVKYPKLEETQTFITPTVSMPSAPMDLNERALVETKANKAAGIHKLSVFLLVFVIVLL